MPKPWTTIEAALLREHYPQGGIPRCQVYINRSANAIQQQAREYGLKAPLGTRSARGCIKPDPFTDAAIREAYANGLKPGDLRKLCARLGRPYWWMSRRTRELGLTVQRAKEPDYSDEELEILSDNAHKNPDTIRRILKARGYKRSMSGIANKLARMDLSRRESRMFNGIYSGAQIAKLFGYENKTALRWVRMGWLKAKPRGTNRAEAQKGDEWEIRIEDVRRFVIEHPTAFDLRRVDQAWFIEYVVGRKVA